MLLFLLNGCLVLNLFRMAKHPKNNFAGIRKINFTRPQNAGKEFWLNRLRYAAEHHGQLPCMRKLLYRHPKIINDHMDE